MRKTEGTVFVAFRHAQTVPSVFVPGVRAYFAGLAREGALLRHWYAPQAMAAA